MFDSNWGRCMATKNTKKANQKKKSQKTTIMISIFFLLVVVSVLFLLRSPESTTSSGTEGLAQCLVDKGYVMAGASWCSHCKDQKALFKGAFESIIIPQKGYVDCESTEANTAWCLEKGVEGYPTWVSPEGDLLAGTRQLDFLAKISGC